MSSPLTTISNMVMSLNKHAKSAAYTRAEDA